MTELATNVDASTGELRQGAQERLDEAANAAWGTFVTLVVAIAVAAVGGLLGAGRDQSAAR